jgi:lipopolysaccharide/colanic/teichoic acid biosynthesis glycosyltransferase
VSPGVSARRLADVVLAAVALVVAAPVLLAAAVGIRLASPGPILYRARRIGLHGRAFTMYKLRTMHVVQSSASAITPLGDPRVFPFGALLRRAKLDEVPQLFNILRGDMAVVGPRPEDPRMVDLFYAPLHHETFRVLPGLTCPGSIYAYTHGEADLDPADPERSYGEDLLPVKLALDLVYVRRASFAYDVSLMARTAWTLGTALVGRRHFPLPPELPEARRIMQAEGGATRATA